MIQEAALARLASLVGCIKSIRLQIVSFAVSRAGSEFLHPTRIVVPGSKGADFALARYKPNGSLDRSFGDGGTVRTDFRGGNDHADVVAIDSHPSKVRTRHRRARAEYSFTADDPASFECKVGSREFRNCSSPYTTPKLRIGKHHLKVRATDQAGNAATMSKRFEIVKRRQI